MTSGTATVKQVISGDTLVLMGTPKGGPPPEKTIVLASIVAPRMAMKSQTRESGDEPFAFEAREFLRKRLIGKVVEFVVEYEHNERNHGTIKYEGENMGVSIVRAGFAKVRNSRPPTCAKNIDELRTAEEAAKEEKLGVWTDEVTKAESTIRDIQWIQNDAPAAKAFVNLHKHQSLPSIIEFVRDGGYFRVYFPQHKINAGIALTGIQVDGFKRIEGYAQPQAEPFALEAKFFTELRLLNRDVNIRIEDADDFGNIFGTVIHPNGNISLLLLRNGFAKIQDWGIRLVENPSQYREAQKEAQSQGIRKWRAWVSPTVEGLKEYQARVIEVSSGDCIIVMPLDGEDDEKRLYLASIRCPRLGTRTRPDEPWAFDSKEFVRKKLIGKKVTVVLEYTKDPVATGSGNTPPATDSSGKMHFVSIYLDKNKPSINELLVIEGFAKTLSHRNEDPRAENFEALLGHEKEAIQLKKGVHGPVSGAPKNRVNELLGPQNAQMARSFEESLKRLNKVDGIVEFVFNGGKFKIRLPSESIAIAFSLGGIKCPQTARQITGQPLKPAEEFSEEATRYSKELLMQRSVTIKVDACDRGGNFIGTLWHGKDCINVQLVERGLARLNGIGFAPGLIRSQLEEAERNAREQRLGLWSSPTAFDAIEEDASSLTPELMKEVPSVCISQCNSVEDFYIQELSVPEIDALQCKIADHVKSISGVAALGEVFSQSILPGANEIVLAKFSEDQEWYRAKINTIDRQRLRFKLTYIDFGNSEFVGLKDIYRCPPKLHPTNIPALARHCTLAGLRVPPEMEAEGAEAFDACTANKSLRCLIEFVDPQLKKSVIQLHPTESEILNGNGVVAGEMNTISINEDLVSRGLAIVDKKGKSTLMQRLQAAESKARKAHIAVWRHGDIDEDSGDDRDFPSLGGRKR